MRRWLPATTTSLVLPRKAARLTSPTTLRPLREGRPLLFLEDRNGPAAHAPCDRFLAGRQHRAQLRADRPILRPAHPGREGDRRRYRRPAAHGPRYAARRRAPPGGTRARPSDRKSVVEG